MSFGWSASDIATAATLLYNIIEALGDDGAAGNYREAIGFLRDLKRTLEPLQTLTAWNAHPTYANEISQQVQHIRGPVEKFLNAAVKYEPSLGAKAKKGRHRHVWTKLQWYLLKENKVSALKDKIKDHMLVIDTLICRLILDVELLAQKTLPGQLRAAFTEVLTPELVSHLRNNLRVTQELQKQHHYEITDKLSEHYTRCSSDIQALRKDLRNSMAVQQRIVSCFTSASSPRNPGPHNPPGFKKVGICVKFDNRQQGWLLDTNSDKTDCQPNSRESQDPTKQVGENVGQKSFHDVYYLVLLYIGHFLKNVFLALSYLIKLPQALIPVLLAKYNISFLDAIGTPPRILPYEYFRNFRVLQTFIQEEFKTLPGSTWVNRGLYRLFTAQCNQPLAKNNWNRLVTPGTTVTMAMLVRKTVDTVEESTIYRCPEKKCGGTWPRRKEAAWVECPACQKRVLTTTSSRIGVQNDKDRPEKRRNKVDRQAAQSSKKGNFNFDDIEIEAFRRILEIRTKAERREFAARPYELPCEFTFIGCSRRYKHTEIENWISHSISHFGDFGPPQKSLCSICDNVDFRAKYNENPTKSWRRRLIHIAKHLQNLEHALRPDFFLIEHMHKHGLISNEVFEQYILYTERPLIRHLHPVSSGTRETALIDMTTGTPHDLRKEKRQMNKHGKEWKTG